MGFLPGDIADKVDPYMQSYISNFKKIAGNELIESLIQYGVIEFKPLAFMRGDTFDEAFMILDEAQNAHKGRTVSQETRNKIANANKGKVHGSEFRDKIRNRLIGNKYRKDKQHTKDSKIKMSNSLKGKEAWNKGIPTPLDVRERQSLAKLNMSQEQKDKMHAWKKGRVLSEEHKKKLSKPQDKVECPHCKKLGGISAMKQYHFDKCKWRIDNPEK